MRKDHERKRIFTRRSLIVGAAQMGLISVVGYRLFDLQVLQARKYKTLSEQNRISLKVLQPKRGLIIDRTGVIIARNRKTFRVTIVREHAQDPKATLLKLRKYIPLTDQEIEDILEKINVRRPFAAVEVKEDLIRKEAFQIEENAFDLPGIFGEESYNRFYPNNEVGAHMLGYVGRVNAQEIKSDNDILLEQPGFRIGKTGAERAYDKALRGRAGNIKVEVNAYGRVVRDLEAFSPTDGYNTVLTLDWELQAYVAERLKGLSAAAVVMNIHTGELMATVSTPSYDPNSFTRGLSNEEWINLRDNAMAPIQNKCLRGAWSPGSTFKIILAIAALEENVVTPDETVHCKGYLEWGNGYKKYCWSRRGHGNVDLAYSLAQSCDVYYYDIAQRLGIEKIARYAHMFGFGERTIDNFPGQFDGIIPTRRWLKERYKQTWRIGDTLNVAIGQGYVVTTPIQNALSFARLCNGGYAVKPIVSRDEVNTQGVWPRKPKAFERLPIKKENLDNVIQGIFEVVNANFGTARGAALPDDWKMMGKTGTVQVRRITEEERKRGITKNEDRAWEYRDHANFVGVAPYGAPRWVTSVFIEHGGGGSSAAAPIVKDIMLKVKEREAIWDNIPYFNAQGVRE
ncbi:MAG: penicillin-binding protein 2 [Alphaproteobacteria bacterium]